eukprot:g9557.t1 g9557   contig37:245802-246246(-)
MREAFAPTLFAVRRRFRVVLLSRPISKASMVICGSHVPQLTSNTLLLLALFPRLDYNTLAQKWQPRTEDLKAYYELYGHYNIDTSGVTSGDNGRFVCNLRHWTTAACDQFSSAPKRLR